MVMKRRDLLRNASIVGGSSLVVLGSTPAAGASSSCSWDERIYCETDAASDPERDAHVVVNDVDTSDNYRSGTVEVWADVDPEDANYAREKVQATILEYRCNAGSCSWAPKVSATAETEFYSDDPQDSAARSNRWELNGDYSFSDDRYRVVVEATTYYNPDDTKTNENTERFGPFRVC
jgi:hypothetical protein